MTKEDLQDTRVWALEQLIRLEKCLDSRMYDCASVYTSNGVGKNKESLYTLWEGWKLQHPSNNPKSNRL